MGGSSGIGWQASTGRDIAHADMPSAWLNHLVVCGPFGRHMRGPRIFLNDSWTQKESVPCPSPHLTFACLGLAGSGKATRVPGWEALRSARVLPLVRWKASFCPTQRDWRRMLTPDFSSTNQFIDRGGCFSLVLVGNQTTFGGEHFYPTLRDWWRIQGDLAASAFAGVS